MPHRDGHMRPRTVAAAMAASALLFGGCSREPPPEPPPESTRASTRVPENSTSSTPTPTPPAPPPVRTLPPARYAYSLPEGDTMNAEDKFVVYMHLQAGNCAKAQEYLDATWWHGFTSPETVVMEQVAVDMCFGRTAAARAQFERGQAMYKWVGVRGERNLCNIYRAYTAFQRQVPLPGRDICPPGELVSWPGWPSAPRTDDPRTDVVETAPHSEEPPFDSETQTPTEQGTAPESTEPTPPSGSTGVPSSEGAP